MEVVVIIILLALAFAWIGWPVFVFADEERIEFWQALLVFLAGSALIFLIVFTMTYVISRVARTVRPEPEHENSPPRSLLFPNLTPEGLIPDHAVNGNKVVAYESHWIAGLEFTFAIIPWPLEKFRIYILRSPQYGPRSTDPHTTHRLMDGPRPYICVDSTHYPDTRTAARELALMWAQATARYIKTGRKFS